MKKVKVMLMALLVVAGVGGALAFKAAKGQALFCGTSGAAHDCPVPSSAFKIAIGTPVNGILCSTVANGDCRTVITD